MSRDTQMLLIVTHGDENAANIDALKQYWRDEGGGEGLQYMSTQGGNPLICYATLRHCNLHAFLPFARALPWKDSEQVQLLIKEDEGPLFTDYKTPLFWAVLQEQKNA